VEGYFHSGEAEGSGSLGNAELAFLRRIHDQTESPGVSSNLHWCFGGGAQSNRRCPAGKCNLRRSGVESRAMQSAPTVPSNEGKKSLRLGLILGVGRDPNDAIAKVHDLGLPTCQVFVDEIDSVLAGRLRQVLDKYQIEATSLVVGGPGKEVWDFYDGPLTIGLVPRETRDARIAHIKKASDFAKQCGIDAVQTHCGFIPENPNDPVYRETIMAMREWWDTANATARISGTKPGRRHPSRLSAPFKTWDWTIRGEFRSR